MAQSEQLDDTTILEHPQFFVKWEPGVGVTCKRGTVLRVDVNGAELLYRALHDIGEHNRLVTPSTSDLYQKIGNPSDEYPEWSQWLGAGDCWKLGDKCRSVDYSAPNDTTVYKWVATQGDASGNTVWRPGEYGWTKEGAYA